MRLTSLLVVGMAVPSATVTGAALVGLGMARHGHAAAVSGAFFGETAPGDWVLIMS